MATTKPGTNEQWDGTNGETNEEFQMRMMREEPSVEEEEWRLIGEFLDNQGDHWWQDLYATYQEVTNFWGKTAALQWWHGVRP